MRRSPRMMFKRRKTSPRDVTQPWLTACHFYYTEALLSHCSQIDDLHAAVLAWDTHDPVNATSNSCVLPPTGQPSVWPLSGKGGGCISATPRAGTQPPREPKIATALRRQGYTTAATDSQRKKGAKNPLGVDIMSLRWSDSEADEMDYAGLCVSPFLAHCAPSCNYFTSSRASSAQL